MSEHRRTVDAIAGVVTFTEVQGTTINIRGSVLGYNSKVGANVVVPATPTATLEGMTSIVTYPATGLTVQDEGVPLVGLYGTLNFAGLGVTVTPAGAGVGLVTIPGSSFINQNPNLVFAGPAAGPAAAPAFRSLVFADIPDLSGSYATKAYADALVVGLLDDRGNYDASGNTFPASGGSGAAGAILKGDLWTVSVGGTLGGTLVTAGDAVRALVDTPGQTAGNWALTENNFGYVAANAALSNLFAVNINSALLFQTGIDVGSAAKPARDLYLFGSGAHGTTSLKLTGTPTGARVVTFPDASISVPGLSLNNVWSRGQTITEGTANESVLLSTGGSNTGSNAASAFDLSWILNTSGSPDVVALRVTDTARGASTKLLNIYGGTSGITSLFNIKRDGTTNMGTGVASVDGTSGNLVVWTGGKIGFTSSADASNGTPLDTGFGRNAGGIFEVNNGTTGRWGGLKAGFYGAATNVVANGITIGTRSSGTPAPGLGAGLLFNIDSSTTPDQNAAQIDARWTTATHATRSADIVFSTVLSGAALAESFRVKSDSGVLLTYTSAAANGVSIKNNSATGTPTWTVGVGTGATGNDGGLYFWKNGGAVFGVDAGNNFLLTGYVLGKQAAEFLLVSAHTTTAVGNNAIALSNSGGAGGLRWTSGTGSLVRIGNNATQSNGGEFNPSTGTAKMQWLDITGGVSQTGSATGNYTALNINITETGFLGTIGLLIDAQIGGTTKFSVKNTGDVLTRTVRGQAVTFVNVPAAPVEGMLVAVTDSSTATWGATIAGSGANHVLAYYNGTNWTVAGK